MDNTIVMELSAWCPSAMHKLVEAVRENMDMTDDPHILERLDQIIASIAKALHDCNGDDLVFDPTGPGTPAYELYEAACFEYAKHDESLKFCSLRDRMCRHLSFHNRDTDEWVEGLKDRCADVEAMEELRDYMESP